MLERLRRGLRAFFAAVRAEDVGRPNDGLIEQLLSAGTDIDKSWHDLSQEFTDAREAWRKNPLARRIVGLITSYVVGGGVTLSSDYAPLNRFIRAFTAHRQTRLALRQPEMCNELARAGELFPILFTNPADGMSYLRLMPASRIDRIEWKKGDYETELRYHEVGDIENPDGTWWLSPEHPDANKPGADGSLPPVMLHYAVNRPVGALRGESDLAPILPWLKRYSRWLEDRVRLNAAVRAFLWIVKVPGRLVKAKAEQYRRPPESGSVVIADRDSEEWDAITPNIQARDAQADGRAIRWMIAAGGPGTGLVDFGEAETSNLATAKAMGEQRWRFLAQRQAYFGFVLADTVLTAYNRAVALGKVRGKQADLQAVKVSAPDISPSDNRELAGAAAAVVRALRDLRDVGIPDTEAYRRLALRLAMKFAGEVLSTQEIEEILNGNGSRQDKQETAAGNINGYVYVSGNGGEWQQDKQETAASNINGHTHVSGNGGGRRR